MELSKLIWRADSTPAELVPMLETLSEEFPILDHGRGLKVTFKKVSSDDMVSNVIRSRGEVLIEYSTVSSAARAIGSAMCGVVSRGKAPFNTLGIMLDVSRNQVMLVEHVKKWLRRMALAGHNTLMLYTEDTYVIDDMPFFGYMRGGYSIEEIRAIDDYASKLGIEVIGCIQTLGHLRTMLRWNPNAEYRDTSSVMMSNSGKTYDLIEKMVSFWSEALRSRRIHIGMDETHDLGRGKYLDKFGYVEPLRIFTNHLNAVSKICKAKGLRPMMWSDMFFRLTNSQHYYVSDEFKRPEDLVVPDGVDMVFWEYYCKDRKTYETMIDRHVQLGGKPVMASAIMTWGSFWYNHRNTTNVAKPCIDACVAKGVRELIFTMWGDDGAYCEFDSALSGMFYTADKAFGEKDLSNTIAKFESICDSDYDASIAAGNLNAEFEHDGKPYGIWAASLIWDDPLQGISYDDHLRRDPDFALKLIDYCDEIKYRIIPALGRDGAGSMVHALNVTNLLMRKVELRNALEIAYDNDDGAALREIAVTMIPVTIAAVREFDRSFREQWMAKASPLGMEVIQQRNATTIARLEETALRINEYLDGVVDIIEELEERLPMSAPTNIFIGAYDAYWSAGAKLVN